MEHSRKQYLLCPANLQRLHPAVQVPRYSRQLLRPGIVHIGVGGFNRSHLAVYLDDLLQQGHSPNWAEFGIGLRPSDLATHDALSRQEYLYSLLLRDSTRESLRVVGSLMGHLYAPQSSQQAIEAIASPACRIVSMTVTEGGYFTHEASKEFQSEHPEIRHDLQNPERPVTWVGYLAEACALRMRRGLAPITVLSCDNLQDNGTVARRALTAFAEMKDPALRRWMDAAFAFPSSMVDRITPVTTDADRHRIAELLGVVDDAPVVAEPFRQWVVEDHFAADRPRWELVGAQMVADVAPYEEMKLRLLNGGHIALGFPAALLGIEFVSDAVTDPLLHRYLQQFLQEVRPAVRPVPGINLDVYAASLIERFSSPTIQDRVARICLNGVAKVKKFLLPTLNSNLENRRPTAMLSFVLAVWLRYMQGVTDSGVKISIEDDSIHEVSPWLHGAPDDAGLVLSQPSMFGSLAQQFPAFVDQVQRQLDRLRAHGTRNSILALLRDCDHA